METAERQAFWENAWAGVERTASTLVRSGIRDLGRIVDVLEFYKDLGTLDPIHERIAQALAIPCGPDNAPLYRLAVSRGRYVLVPRTFLDETIVAIAIQLMTDDTEWVVELGSGWGRNLFRIFLRAPQRGLRYAACEPAEPGRRVAAQLAGLAEGLELVTVAFDYRRPDFSFLPAGANAVFLTRHSIEQVAELGTRLFESMLARCGRCRCVHLEPVGWQRSEELRRLVAESERSGAASPDQIDLADEALQRNAALWAAGHAYNRDLLAVVERMQREGRIAVRHLVYDFFGDNPFNPSSLIVWEKPD